VSAHDPIRHGLECARGTARRINLAAWRADARIFFDPAGAASREARGRGPSHAPTPAGSFLYQECSMNRDGVEWSSEQQRLGAVYALRTMLVLLGALALLAVLR